MEPDSQNKIYFQQYYKGKSDDEMMKEISHEGFDPLRIINEPGYIYSQHEHPETKILAFLSGSMDVKVNGQQFHCVKGDRIVIPGDTLHEAIVGKNGCVFLWAERVLP